MINKFSAFFSSAAFVKLKLGVIHSFPVNNHDLVMGYGMFIIYKGRNAGIRKKVAAFYFSFRWLLSSIASTLTPLLKASVRDLAIGADVNEYAWTRISDLAALISLTMDSVHPPLGTEADLGGSVVESDVCGIRELENTSKAKSQCCYYY